MPGGDVDRRRASRCAGRTSRPRSPPGSRRVPRQRIRRPAGVNAAPGPYLRARSKSASFRLQSFPCSPLAHASSTGPGRSTVCNGSRPGGRGRDGEQRARAVRRAAVQQVVVHLHHDLAARRERDARCRPGSRFPPQPGAQAAIQFALFSESAIPAPSPGRKPVPPKHDQPGPASPASSFFASATCVRGNAEEDHVVHDLGLSRLDPRGGHERVAPSASGRGGSSGSRRSRPSAPTACTPPACAGSAASRRHEPRGPSALRACGRGRRPCRRPGPTRGSSRAGRRSASACPGRRRRASASRAATAA